MNVRTATAYHEAGHAVAAVLFGWEIQAVSIRAGVAHQGVTLHHVPDDQRVDLDALLGGEVALTDRAARRIVEATIVSLLAGQIAEQYVAPISGYEPTPVAVSHAADALAMLTPRHRELLWQSEARAEPAGDQQAAEELSLRLAADEAGAHLAWLRAVARRLVNDHAAAIRSVASRLLAAEVLDGTTVRTIVREETETP